MQQSEESGKICTYFSIHYERLLLYFNKLDLYPNGINKLKRKIVQTFAPIWVFHESQVSIPNWIFSEPSLQQDQH
jgi:hypothetical protein